jgi:hypothetical protein
MILKTERSRRDSIEAERWHLHQSGIRARTLFVYFKQRQKTKGRQSDGNFVGMCLQVGNSP